MNTVGFANAGHSINYNTNDVKHMFQIAHVFGYEKNITFDNTDAELIIGRRPESNIHLPYDTISRVHAKIRIQNGNCYLSDLGSRNKTYVNNMPVDGEYQLKTNDVIMFKDSNYMLVVTIKYSCADGKKSNNGDTITIGRSQSNDIVVNHVAASRVHAVVTRQNDGRCYISDNKSLNGTFVNGMRVTGRILLNKGDKIMIAGTKLYFDGSTVTYSVLSEGLSLSAVNISKVVVNSNTQKTILNNVSFNVESGSFVALVGGSGAGKSTLMDCLNGFRPATSGRVIVNGEDFYANYDSYKSIIGYVPQQDVVYKNLTVWQMLSYSAQLRMPEDTTPGERKERIKQVIKDVSLEGKEDLRISKLSGGQKKRVSIAVELLADPKLLYLDEPTSGLDPGLDKSMMELLSSLAKKGTTVILITHATANITLCDKVVFLGVGGRLCYYGEPSGLLEHFEVSDVPDIYKKLSIASGKDADKILESNALYFEQKYKRKAVEGDKSVHNTSVGSPATKRKKVGAARQLAILIRRYFKLISSDIASLILMFGQAPIMLVILNTVLTSQTFRYHDKAKQFLFVVSSIATIMGVLNSFIEICKERDIFKREYAVNLSLKAYIASKIIVLGIICFVQSLVLCVGINYMADLPSHSLVFGSFGEFWFTTYLILLASTGMGLLISTISPNTERATLYMPIVIIPQIVFSGLMFELDGIKKIVSWFVVNRWGVGAYGSLFKIKNIEKLSMLPKDMQYLFEEMDLDMSLYKPFADYLLTCWGALLLTVTACLVLMYIYIKRENKNR